MTELQQQKIAESVLAVISLAIMTGISRKEGVLVFAVAASITEEIERNPTIEDNLGVEMLKAIIAREAERLGL